MLKLKIGITGTGTCNLKCILHYIQLKNVNKNFPCSQKAEAPPVEAAEADTEEKPEEGVPMEREVGEGEEEKPPTAAAPVPPKVGTLVKGNAS